MREIKFRVWNGGEFDYLEIKPNLHLNLLSIAPHVTIEQYTGLKDKDAKEIYEGDIISNTLGLDESFYLIGFRKGGFVLIDSDSKEYFDDLCEWDDKSEVIGNIHESPELLNKTA